MTIPQIINEPTEKVAQWAVPEYFMPIEIKIDTVEDLQKLSLQLPILSNQYSYIAAVLSYLKFTKRNAPDKETKNALIDKEEIMTKALESVKMKYQSISRAITLRQEINKELDMGKFV